MSIFQPVAEEIQPFIFEWEEKLLSLSEKTISEPRNSQNRSVKEIVGHMVDSASNNTHRVVHLQYCKSPLEFPNYATYGNNDRWIAIQNYQEENWENLVKLWKYTHLHFIHIIQNVNQQKLNNEWIADKSLKLSLKNMVDDFPRHFKLHIKEIEELTDLKQNR